MRKSWIILILVLVVSAFAAAIVAPVAADGELPTLTEPTTGPVTVVTTERTTVPTTEPTVVPTTERTTVPTTERTTEPTVTVPTVVTQPVTTRVTTEPTITIPTVVTEPTQVGGGKGYIDTYCNVDGAAVSFDGKYECTIAQGVCTVGVSPTGTPVRTVTVAKSGYTTWSGSLPSMPGNGQHVAVYSTLNPVPTTPTTAPPVQTGTIYAQSSPSGAAIYLNGNLYGYSPVTMPGLYPGSYTVKAVLNGYTPYSQVVNVYSGQTTTFYPTLQPSPPSPHSTGTVKVTSAPSSAMVYVDGTYQGKTPVTVTLYPGTHTFKLTLAGYADYVTTLVVNANTNQNLNAQMSPAIFGTVSITTLPGASVYMDSAMQGKVSSSGVLTIPSVTSGNHLFKVTATGYNDWMNTVYIQPNAVTPILATLTPTGSGPAPAATGSIQIVSTPTGAEIYLDNLFKGYTPSTLTGITAGQHQLLMKYTGYVDYTQPVSVTAGQTTPLAISMQAAPAPTPASPLSPVTALAGILAAAGIAALIRRRS